MSMLGKQIEIGKQAKALADLIIERLSEGRIWC